MATKKSVKKKEIKKEEVVEKARYFYAVGKRKMAVAQIRLYPGGKEENFLVNNREISKYFTIDRLREIAQAALTASGMAGKFNVAVKVTGGGISAQAEALRLGIARALVKSDETLRKSLRDRGYLTRDPRIVERKKPGLKKARRAPQWAKR